MILERSPNWPKVYGDNLSLHGDSFAGYMGNLTSKTEKSGTVGAFDKAGNVDTICILLGDVDPTAEKPYRSDLEKLYRSDLKCVLVFSMSYT